MFACVDVQYDSASGTAKAAVASFLDWGSPRSNEEHVVTVPVTEPYVAGQFYKRELPCLVAVLALLSATPRVVLVDGYVWLGDGREGLGARLHAALGGPAIVGVAKKSFPGTGAIEIFRGQSLAPLYVTASGMSTFTAASGVSSMHGKHRLPTLLKRVDHLARGLESPIL